MRNLTVFDGFQEVDASNAAEKSFTISGFKAPTTGTVNVNVSAIAYEGDRGTTGDYMKLNNTQLGTALSPRSNFFDSAIGFNGANVLTRSPSDLNNLGFDIENLGADGSIPNAATSATVSFDTNGDGYHLGLFATAINLWAPDFRRRRRPSSTTTATRRRVLATCCSSRSSTTTPAKARRWARSRLTPSPPGSSTCRARSCCWPTPARLRGP